VHASEARAAAAEEQLLALTQQLQQSRTHGLVVQAGCGEEQLLALTQQEEEEEEEEEEELLSELVVEPECLE
jgi:hypothetical protein